MIRLNVNIKIQTLIMIIVCELIIIIIYYHLVYT